MSQEAAVQEALGELGVGALSSAGWSRGARGGFVGGGQLAALLLGGLMLVGGAAAGGALLCVRRARRYVMVTMLRWAPLLILYYTLHS